MKAFVNFFLKLRSARSTEFLWISFSTLYLRTNSCIPKEYQRFHHLWKPKYRPGCNGILQYGRYSRWYLGFESLSRFNQAPRLRITVRTIAHCHFCQAQWLETKLLIWADQTEIIRSPPLMMRTFLYWLEITKKTSWVLISPVSL